MLLNIRMNLALNFIKDGKIVATALTREPDLDPDIYDILQLILDGFYADEIKNISDTKQRVVKAIESIGGRLYDDSVKEVEKNGCEFSKIEEYSDIFVVVSPEEIEEINNNYQIYTFNYDVDEDKLQLRLCGGFTDLQEFADELLCNGSILYQLCMYDDIPWEECAEHLKIVPTLDYTLPDKYYGIVEFPYSSEYIHYKDLDDVIKYLNCQDNMLIAKDGVYLYVNR